MARESGAGSGGRAVVGAEASGCVQPAAGADAPALSFAGAEAPVLSFASAEAPVLSFASAEAPVLSFASAEAPVLSFAGAEAPVLSFAGAEAHSLSLEGARAPALPRRALLVGGGASLGLAALGCQSGPTPAALPAASSGAQRAIPSGAQGATRRAAPVTHPSVVRERVRLGAPPWKTFDPFLFCVHHRDAFPPGNARLGPAAPLAGRRIGQDFDGRDGWNMYHGDVVPGFPRHPHRGFETVTITRRGFVDHSDSLGATARYGEGDVQWMTAGSGIVHAEMFPLLDARAPNPAELFQIWLNLPARNKFARPHFSMFWQSQVPRRELRDERGRVTALTVIAGELGDARAPLPPPQSWAADPGASVTIWSLVMAPGARFELPEAPPGVERTLYLFAGDAARIGGAELRAPEAARLAGGRPAPIENGPRAAELLLLAGRPIGEPVVQHGPFVMNHRSEIAQAIEDYRDTGFGGWPWPAGDPVHPRGEGRFAIHADGRRERAI